MSITKQEYNNLTNINKNVKIKLCNLTPRTLLYGYTCSRNSYHVFLDEKGYVNKYIYDYHKNKLCYEKYETLKSTDLYDLIPDKRVYPESMDYEFLIVLLKNNIYVPFTCYDEERYEKVKNLQYHGEIYEETIE